MYEDDRSLNFTAKIFETETTTAEKIARGSDLCEIQHSVLADAELRFHLVVQL